MTNVTQPSDWPANSLRVLAVGDIVGRPGRRAVVDLLPSFREDQRIDFCMANGENLAGGAGIMPEEAKALLEAGVDVITAGDHVWKKQQIIPFMEGTDRLLRPANFSSVASGRGYGCYPTHTGHDVGVVNLIGRAFMTSISDCPFRTAGELTAKLRGRTPIVLVDFHAESTSEKMAMGWHLDGKVSAVLGTHTHVQTADERILPGGTAYITDLGMTGPYDSVIGRRTDRVLKYLTTQMPARFDVAKRNVKLCGVIVTVDASSGRALDVTRVQVEAPEPTQEGQAP